MNQRKLARMISREVEAALEAASTPTEAQRLEAGRKAAVQANNEAEQFADRTIAIGTLGLSKLIDKL